MKNIAISQFTKITTERLNALTKLVEAGAIRISVDKTFPLSKAAEALRYLETGHPKGKVVMQVKNLDFKLEKCLYFEQ